MDEIPPEDWIASQKAYFMGKLDETLIDSGRTERALRNLIQADWRERGEK
jgi:hypothetical protein